MANVLFLSFRAPSSSASLVSPPLLLPNCMCKPSCTHWGHTAMPVDSIRGNSTCIGRKIYEQSKLMVMVFKPPITRGDITKFSGSECTFLLKFCPVFHELVDLLNIRRAWSKEVYSLVTWNVKNNLLLFNLNLSFVICFRVTSPKCCSRRHGEQLPLLCVTWVPQRAWALSAAFSLGWKIILYFVPCTGDTKKHSVPFLVRIYFMWDQENEELRTTHSCSVAKSWFLICSLFLSWHMPFCLLTTEFTTTVVCVYSKILELRVRDKMSSEVDAYLNLEACLPFCSALWLCTLNFITCFTSQPFPVEKSCMFSQLTRIFFCCE